MLELQLLASSSKPARRENVLFAFVMRGWEEAPRAHRPCLHLTCRLFLLLKPQQRRRRLLPFIRSDYFDDYGQSQISSIQFSPDGLYLAIVTDDR